MAKKKDVWMDGFTMGVCWAANNPSMAQDIEARPFPEERAQEWIEANSREVKAIRTGEKEPSLADAKEPKANVAKAGR